MFAQLRENVKAWGRAFGSLGGFSLLPFLLPPSGILSWTKNNLKNPPAEDAESLASILCALTYRTVPGLLSLRAYFV